MKFRYCFPLLLLAGSLFSQRRSAGYNDYFMEGSYLLLENEPEKALQNFQKAYELDSSSANINYMLGVAYMESPGDKGRAEYYLAKAIPYISKKYKTDNASEKNAPPLAQFYYAKALHFNYKFDEALKQLEAFSTTVHKKDIEYVKMVEKEVTQAKLAKQMTDYPQNVIITNLGEAINTQFSEYSALISGDERTLIFTTTRPAGTRKQLSGLEYEDIVVSYKDNTGVWTKPVPLGINTIGHEASINLSADGQTLIVFKNEEGGENPAGNGNLYYTVFDGQDWSTLEEFGSDVNSPYMESHACLSADGNLLFFSSERPGGYGGKDIYRCVKLPNGKWSKALNLGPEINSEFDEDGGFISPDGLTFYFASNGLKSMGGYDILYATLNEENRFENVMNIGYPINTTDDDIFYVTSPDAKRAYFASSKTGGYGDKDIYMLTLSETRETFLALFKGQILPADDEPLPPNITVVVTDKETNEMIGIYRPKIVNGTFSTILPPGKTYNFSYQIKNGEEFYNEEIYVSNQYAYQEINREVLLEPVKLSGKVKVVQNTIVLNAMVLDNSKDRNPVPEARITILDEKGARQLFTTNDEGKLSGVILMAEKRYTVTAETDKKKSEPFLITTEGNKSAKNLDEVIYLEPLKKDSVSKDIVLDVTVKHPRSKKAIPMASVRLMTASGDKQELTTDEQGVLKDVQLLPLTKYKLMAYKDNAASMEIAFTTGPENKAARIVKNLSVAFDMAVTVSDIQNDYTKRDTAAGFYMFNYSYGISEIDVKDQYFQEFLHYAEIFSKAKEVMNIYITGSASYVPMKTPGGNPELAAKRAANFRKLLETELAKRGLDVSKINFILNSAVSGPQYRGDYILNRKVYEKYQYIRARVY